MTGQEVRATAKEAMTQMGKVTASKVKDSRQSNGTDGGRGIDNRASESMIVRGSNGTDWWGSKESRQRNRYGGHNQNQLSRQQNKWNGGGGHVKGSNSTNSTVRGH